MLIQFKPNYDHQRVKQEDSHPGFIRDGGKRLEHQQYSSSYLMKTDGCGGGDYHHGYYGGSHLYKGEEETQVDRYRSQITHSFREKVARVKQEIDVLTQDNFEAFKDVKLPVARIKKIMKSDQDVRMISIEAPILFSKACELFVMELTHKALFYARRDDRKVIQKVDLANSVTESEVHDFLIDLIPEQDMARLQETRKLTPYQKKLLHDVRHLKKKHKNETSKKSTSSISGAPASFGQSLDCPNSSLFKASSSNSIGEHNTHSSKSYPSGSIMSQNNNSNQNSNESKNAKQKQTSTQSQKPVQKEDKQSFKRIFVTKHVTNL